MTEEFRHIVRIAGADLDGTKKLPYGLTKIKGIGFRIADALVKVSGLDPKTRIGYLTESDVSKLEAAIKAPSEHGVPAWLLNKQRNLETGEDLHLIGSDLVLSTRSDIESMIRSRSWAGNRHSLGLKVRGQRTRTTGRKGRSVGVSKKTLRQMKR